jgi:hypothetical protein
MRKRIFVCLTFVCLIAVSLAAADDPFVGKWKFNQTKSTTPVLSIESLGGNRYKITLGDSVNTILADGNDQPADFGRTLSLKEESPNVWRAVWKKDGKPIDEGRWTVQADGQSLVQEYTVHLRNGKSSRGQNKLKRTSGNSGLAGTWEFRERTGEIPFVLEIRPFKDGGLTLLLPAIEYSASMKFDGKEYPQHGPDFPAGSTTSGRRLDSRTLETLDTANGNVVRHQKWTISPDGATLTVEDVGQGREIWDRM